MEWAAVPAPAPRKGRVPRSRLGVRPEGRRLKRCAATRRWCRPATKAAPRGAPCWRPLEAAQHGGRDTADHGHERGLAARALPQAEAGA
eukprot:scaffold13451_cov54-Phaeocystis_antarctica.AAC.5